MTADGNYDMTAKKLTNVGAPTDDKDAATKKYVDDNVTSGGGGPPATSKLVVDSNIDMKDQYRLLNLKSSLDDNEPATKSYADSTFLNIDGSKAMNGNLNMANKKIVSLSTPAINNDAATKITKITKLMEVFF